MKLFEIKRDEAIERIKFAASKLEVTNLFLTGSLARKEEGGDIDLIWAPSNGRLRDIESIAFDLAWALSTANKRKATTLDMNVKVDIFVELDDRLKEKFLKDPMIQRKFGIKEEVEDVKYLIVSCGGGNAWANGYWKTEMHKGQKVA